MVLWVQIPVLTNMMELELFQIYHLKEMSLSAELFLSCSILQFTFYAISTAYQRKTGFIVLNKQVYYIAFLLIVLALFLILNEDLLTFNSFSSNNFIINDYFSFASKLVICLASSLFLLIINVSFRDEPVQNNFEYAVLITISVLGLLLLCSSNDLITAYLAIELQSIAFYIMSAFKRNSSYSVESGLKYFIIGSLSSAFFLFGASIIYGCMGSLNFDDLQLFFSLLSINNIETPMLFYTSFLSTVSENELFFSVSFSEATKNLPEFVFSFLNESVQSNMNTLTVASTTSESLIDWCYINHLNGFSNTLPLNLLSLSLISPFDTITLSYCPLNFSEFYTQVFSVFYISSLLSPCELGSFYYDNLWGSFFLNSETNLTIQYPLFKEIYMSYKNSSHVRMVYDLSSSLHLDLVSIGFLLVCLSLFIKLSIAPFHFWSLDVYEGSPNATTFFFAVVPKMGLFILLTRLCYISFYPIFVNSYQVYFLLLAVFSIFVGSIGGLEQRKLKTLLAYSSVSHTGYLLLSFSTGNLEGVQLMFYYLIIYMISGACFWSIYLFLREKKNFYFDKSNKELGDIILLKESNPILALVLAITLFSIAGIPPMVGFLAKVGVFLVAIKSSIYLLSILSIIFSVISTFYYIRLIKILYFENALVGKLYLPVTTQKSLLIAVLSLALIVLAVDPMVIYCLFYKAILLMY